MSINLKSELLKQLYKGNGKPISGQEMADQFGVSRTAIWKYIKELENEGHQIGTIRKKGYYLIDSPDLLNEANIQKQLQTKRYGHHVQYYASCTSTQILAHELAQEGVPDGTVVIAEEQTDGKGRLARAWDSAAGKGIWMSIIMRPQLIPQQAPQITLVAAVAIVRAIEEVVGILATIKWPNDILINGRKVTGILTELQADPDRIKAIVLGIGVNVNQLADDFPKSLQTIATSLREQSGSFIDRPTLVSSLLYYLELYTEMYEKHGFEPIKVLWESYSMTIGKQVRAVMLHETYEGTAIGISKEGLLQLQLQDGSVKEIYSADIQLL